MSVGVLILLILVAVLLITIEIAVIPGFTFIGLLGLLILFASVVLAYVNFGIQFGNMVLLGSTLITVALFYLGYRFFSSHGIVLRQDLSESVVEPASRDIPVKPGDVGVAFGDIKPQGNAIINNRTIWVRSAGEYIPDNAEVEVVIADGNRIIVKSLFNPSKV